MDRDLVPSITNICLPARHEIDHAIKGLRIRRLIHPATDLAGTVLPFRSRGQTCRRQLLAAADGQQIVVELASVRDTYDFTVTGIERAPRTTLHDGRLNLEDAFFRLAPSEVAEFASLYVVRPIRTSEVLS